MSDMTEAEKQARKKKVDAKIQECMAALQRGETNIKLERGDLTVEELEYIRDTVKRMTLNNKLSRFRKS